MLQAVLASSAEPRPIAQIPAPASRQPVAHSISSSTTATAHRQPACGHVDNAEEALPTLPTAPTNAMPTRDTYRPRNSAGPHLIPEATSSTSAEPGHPQILPGRPFLVCGV